MMKKCLLTVAVVAFAALLFTSCGKSCMCKTTRTTATTSDSMVNDFGKMSEKDCLEYNKTYNDGEGITRTIDCHLE